MAKSSPRRAASSKGLIASGLQPRESELPRAPSSTAARLWVPGLRRQRCVDDGLRFAQESAQMAVAAKTLGVDLIDVLGAGRTGGKPSARRDDLDTADRRIVAGGFRQHALDRLAGHFRYPALLRRQAPPLLAFLR